MEDINVGDVVKLTGGSPPLTVIEIKDNQAVCCWMGYLWERYPLTALVRVVTQDDLDHARKEYRWE